MAIKEGYQLTEILDCKSMQLLTCSHILSRAEMSGPNRIDTNSPLWDQSTFYGRFRHFFWMTNPVNAFHSETELNRAKELVSLYKLGKEPPGTTEEQVKHAMKLYSSSFHPDTGELQSVFGRMSFQVPGGMFITGAMLQFYKSVPQVIFWQWFNQSFNALVNFTNRNAESELSVSQLGFAYATATFSALATAVGLKRALEKSAPPMVQRFVPMVAVAAANCVNIPLMRQAELKNGVELKDENGNQACKSKYAASKGIFQVIANLRTRMHL